MLKKWDNVPKKGELDRSEIQAIPDFAEKWISTLGMNFVTKNQIHC